MTAPVRSISDRLRVTSGIPAAMACDAIIKSKSAIPSPRAWSNAFSLPHTADVAWSGFKMRFSHQMWIVSNHVSRRRRWAGSVALAMPYSISHKTIVDRKQGRRFSSMNLRTRSSGLGLASSLQTLVSISTKNLAILGEIGTRWKLEPNPACYITKISEKFAAAHCANARRLSGIMRAFKFRSDCERFGLKTVERLFQVTHSLCRGMPPKIRLNHQLPQMFFHRTAMRSGNLAKAQFGVFWNVSDRQTRHKLKSDSIAMQSMYAMKAL
jgi:hypothetical protein